MPANRQERTKPVVKTDPFVSMAQDAYDASTSYIDANYRRDWENAINAFYNQHPAGSKYLHASYRYRSKLYRPKTRATIRRGEAAAVAAFFGNMDLVKVDPVNEAKREQVMSAQVNHYILNHRLEKTIPWFKVCIGAVQDALTIGAVCSYNHWSFKRREEKIIEDKPVIDLRPVENVRIDPAASWLDPINDSPYVVDLVPMYVMDIEMMMMTMDPKTGQPKWKNYSRADIQSVCKDANDTTRLIRLQGRSDPLDEREITGFDTAVVHRNIMRVHGQEMVWYTLGKQKLLSEPEFLEDVYHHGERPYVMGSTIIETHKIYPSGIPKMTEGLQKETNEIANSRLDNVKLVINKRYFIKQGHSVDMQSLVRNAPASATLMTDPDGSVKVVDFNDVTSSAYAEQDRVNVDYDELAGSFSPGSLQSNRQLNETVGGIQILRGDAGTMTGYNLKTFVETWMQPTLRQIVKLEQEYETDETVLELAGEKSQFWQQWGVNADIDYILDQELNVTVNVGMTATDPGARLNQLILVADAFVKIAAQNPGMDLKVLADEMFGKIGYRDSSKFWPEEGDSPEVAQLKTTLAQLQQELATGVHKSRFDAQSKLLLEDRKAEHAGKAKLAELEQEKERLLIDADVKKYIANIDARTKVVIENMRQDEARKDRLIGRVDKQAERQQSMAQAAAPAEQSRKENQTAQAVADLAQEVNESEEEREKIRAAILAYLKENGTEKMQGLVNQLESIEQPGGRNEQRNGEGAEG